MVWLLWILMLHIAPVSLSLSGPNTTGTISLLAGSLVYLAGGDNITLSQNQRSLTIIGGTNFAPPGAYLTTAALSQDSSKYAGTNGAITGGSITVNTSGVSVNLPAYLTTADLSQNSSKYAGTNGAMTGGSITVNTSGVSVNLPNYLTTAALSADSSKYAGTNGAITGGSVTVNTSGVSINLPAYLTTADLSQNSSKYAGTVGAITGGSITVNTAGVSVNLPAYLTTADLSANSSNYFRNWKLTGGTAGTTSSAQGTDLWLAGGNGVTLSGSSNTVSFSVNTNYQSQGAYLTTAALSQDSSKYAGTNGAITGGSITVNTSGVSVNLPAYLTTAMASNRGSDFVQATAVFAGTNASGTIASGGISVSVAAPSGSAIKAFGVSNTGQTAGNTGVSTGIDWVLAGSQSLTLSQSTAAGGPNTVWLQHPAWLTTAALSGDTTKYVQNWKLTGGTAGTTSSAQGTDLWLAGGNGVTISGSSNTLSFSVNTNYQAPGAYLTTAALSGDTSKYVQNWKLTGNTSGTTSSAQGTDVWFAGGNGLTIFGSSNTLSFSVATNYQSQGAYLTTAMAVNQSDDYVFASAAFAGTNASGTIASTGISVSVAAGGGGNTLSFFEPIDYVDMASATSTGGIGTLHLLPIVLPAALSFAQLNVIASGALPSTTAANSFSVSAGGASSVVFQATFSNSNSQFIDVYLFSKGTGGFTTNLQTYASTRNSIITFQTHTLQLSVTGNSGPSGSMSWSIKSSVSVQVSFPALTSGTVTSINNASTVTTWGTGYTNWTGSNSTSKSSVNSSSASALASCPGTWPATTEWASMKLVPLMFATSMAGGENWVGFNLSSSTSSSSASASTGGGAGHTYTSSVNASNLTQSQAFTYVGGTNSLASSLGVLGSNTQATLAPSPGHGSFSATYNPGSTYLNNAGQPNGALAFSQINSNVSFFKTWMQFANYRI